MSGALSNSNYNDAAFGAGYDPGARARFQDAKKLLEEREAAYAQEQAASEGATGGSPFGSLTLGPHTMNLVKGIVGDIAFGAWDDFNQWLVDNEAIFTGEAGAEMRSIFIHAFNTGSAMRADDEERNGKNTFFLVS